MLESKNATKLVKEIVNSSDFLKLAKSYSKYVDEFFPSAMIKTLPASTLLVAAYEAGLKIGVSRDKKGNKLFCPFVSGKKFFKINGSLKDALESYYNLELLNAS